MHNFQKDWRILVLGAAVLGLVLMPAVSTMAGEPSTVMNGPVSSASLGPPSSHQGESLDRGHPYPRSTYMWPYATGPIYGQVSRSDWNAPGVIHTAVGSFDLARGVAGFPGELKTTVKFGRLAAQYFIVQLTPSAIASGALADVERAVEENGGAVVQSMTVASLIARLTQPAYDAVLAAPGVHAVEPYHPAFKLSPTIGRVPLYDPVKAVSDVYDLDVQIFPGEDAGAVAQAIADLGGNVRANWGDVIRVELNRTKLAALAALEPVRMIHEHLPMFPKGEETTTTMQTGAYNTGAIPYHDEGIDGSGGTVGSPQHLMVLDTGIQLDNGDLSDTRTTAGTAGVSHRKVLAYNTTNPFGGGGDSLGCDDTLQGGSTHGHVVSATALGNATNVDPGTYGNGWTAQDPQGNIWKMDGVAPKALVVAYDAQVTPTSGLCDDPFTSTGLNIGNVYTRGGSGTGEGSLADGYRNYGVRVTNFSWGSKQNPAYGTDATKIDQFLFDFPDAMVFLSAGNEGDDTDSDGIPDPNSVSDPASSKNAVVVGASRNANDQNPGSSWNPESRAFFSSVGPATSTSSRIAPLLMAPGDDIFNPAGMGIDSEYTCRSNDNDSADPVECDLLDNMSGTSFSSPAAAGAALLVRDYFAQGFYPEKKSVPGNATNISGALVKAILVASADYMSGANLSREYRFTTEQGYGRIQLDNAVPLTTWPTPNFLIVADGACGSTGPCPNNTSLSGSATNGATENYNFKVNDNTQELRIACAWIEDSGENMVNDIDLELCPSDGAGNCTGGQAVYLGNFFTEDQNDNNVLDTGEDCNADGLIDSDQWNLDTTGCSGDKADHANPTEGIFLSPDPAGDGIADDPATPGIDESADNQIVPGDWTLKVKGTSIGTSGQPYACAIAGPVALESSISFDHGTYACNSLSTITVNEVDDTAHDPASGLTPGEISSRVMVQVLDSFDTVMDQEDGTLTFTQPDASVLRFTAVDVALTDGTARDPASTWGNGVLDIRSGERIKAFYRDKTDGVTDPAKERTNQATVNCQPAVAFGGVEWALFGRNSFALVDGGCERDARGMFTFGFPDQYMDAGETVGYMVAFRSAESTLDLQGAELSLRCVQTDTDSPPDCKPGDFTACADPNRENNPDCSGLLTILDSPKVLGQLPAGRLSSANFTVKMADTITGTPEIEMLVGLKAPTSGKPIDGLVVSRHTLDVDQLSLFYSTDFPTGGVEYRDYDNDESITNIGDLNCAKDVPCTEADRGTPTTDLDFLSDYRFEAIQWSDLSKNPQNPTSQMPWNFDGNNGGFRVGLHNATDRGIGAIVANWGEDKNFNGILDPSLQEDRDPANGQLDNNWGTLGGCGWQTASGTNRGVWHTGTIRDTGLSLCMGNGSQSAQCQNYETIPWQGGFAAPQIWVDALKTPEFYKVNTATDTNGNPIYQVEFMNWAWNTEINMADEHALFLWELDTDTKALTGSNLDSFPVLNGMGGVYGAVGGGNAPITDGFAVFATNHGCSADTSVLCASDDDCDSLGLGTCVFVADSRNGVAGNNRQGKNCCYFESSANALNLPLHLAQPADDDLDNDRRCENNADVTCIDDAHCGVCTGDSTLFCNDNTDCSDAGAGTCDTAAAGTACLAGDASIDEYVTANGPIRNFDITQVNGPDMRFTTLEDVYRLPSGDSFQAALDFYVEEGTPFDQPLPDYGVAVDDMVVEWREFKLDKDATTCDPLSGGGECAVIQVQGRWLYQNSALLRVRVLDSTPYGPDGVNNCNLDRVCANDTNIVCETSKDCVSVGGGCVNDFTDPGDDTDCNDNGTPDVIAKASTNTTTDVEPVVLDQVAPGEYEATIPVSSAADIPGTLFVTRSGTTDPTARVRYEDLDDGTGNRCNNDVDPDQNGFLDAGATFTFDTGSVLAFNSRLTAVSGDTDSFADTNETLDMNIQIANKTGRDLDNVVARLSTNDPKIDCVIQPFINFGTVLKDAIVDSTDPSVNQAFRFKVASFADRAGGTCSGGTCSNDPLRSCTTSTQCQFNESDDYSTTFVVTVTSNLFDGTTRPQTFTMALDLNASGGGIPQTYTDGFETNSATYGKMDAQSLDTGKNSVPLSNGYRCQYNDPDDPSSNSYQNPECFLGFANTGDNGFDWHVHTTSTSGDGGRAYSGNKSLHWGVHAGGDPRQDTTRFKQLDAVITKDPINLGWDAASPQLSFKQQVNLMDYRQSNTPVGESVDRAVVHIRLADAAGNGIGDWIKLSPYTNIYDVQGTDAFSNCLFDPVDDGNNEDSRFPPPEDDHGPSSTCYPEFVFGWQGETQWDSTFNANAVGRGEGPALQGAIDTGTWVETKFDLSGYLGRRIRLRFLATSIEISTAVTYTDAGWPSNISEDDGWYIDDVQVTDTLASAATLTMDNTDNSGLPPCGATCTTLTASLTSDPAALGAPGQVVTLDASGSSADKCLNGTLQFQFWIDGDTNGTVGDPGDTMLRDWTDNPIYVDAPGSTTTYAVKVRCSADPTCGAGTDVATDLVDVTCPSTGTLLGPPLADTVLFSGKNTLTWSTVQVVDVDRGNLITLRTGGTFTGSVEVCLGNDVNINSITDTTTPAPGGGLYYVVRNRPFCNQVGTWGTGSDAVDRDSQLNLDGNSCP